MAPTQPLDSVTSNWQTVAQHITLVPMSRVMHNCWCSNLEEPRDSIRSTGWLEHCNQNLVLWSLCKVSYAFVVCTYS